MTDNEIRQILAERKRQERKQEKRAMIIEAAENIIGWASLFAMAFMLAGVAV